MDCVVRDELNNWKYLVQPPDNAFGRQVYPDNYYFINGSLYGYSLNYLQNDSGSIKDLPFEVFFEVPRSRGLEIDYFDDLLT